VVLQALHGLSDFETGAGIAGVTCGGRLPAGWGLLDTGFDPSLLTYFRAGRLAVF